MSSTTSKKVIVVFGATGVTGGSVAKYLLEDGEFAVRAVTRNANSEKAKALEAAGADVVEADLSKPETLSAALEGAYGVSAVTDFWSIFPTVNGDAAAAQEEETRQGRALVDAAKAAGIKHFVWFNLFDCDVPHAVSKHHVATYLEASGLSHTNFINSFYYENVINPAFGMLARQENGTLLLNIPQPAHTNIPAYSAGQTGAYILEVFKNPQKWLGKEMMVVGDHTSPQAIADILGTALGEPVKTLDITYDQLVANTQSPNPFVKEMALNFKFFVDHCDRPPNSLFPPASASAAIYPAQQDFSTFVSENEGFKKFAASLKAGKSAV